MTDEKFTFIEDVRDKKRTATGAHHKRTHCGKGGAVKFPSDFMTKKERDAMNGEVKRYRLNEPMTWGEFKAMPDDLKITYIKALRDRYNVSSSKIAEMMGISRCRMAKEVARLGLEHGATGRRTWDEDGWYAWVGGVPKKEEAAEGVVEEVTEEPVPPADLKFAKVEYDEPKEEPKEAPKMIVPRCGTMCFDGNAREALAAIALMLGDENVRLNVTWEVQHEKEACES